ncbi:nucleotidyltransferase family protein [Halobacteriaceae archaeon SHR40]|uniref:sugar phosphate nucleotidyltransferase n=1 Tax=Halovenus amylolytica TaxID=2500550 RepID=UPI000FE2EBEE
MEAVVLAGGYATRLWPITKNRPKMLLPVGETTVIDRILTGLEEDERVENIYLSTNEAFADEFETHIDQEGYEKTQLSVEDTSDEAEKFGVVGALAQLVEREGVDDDLLVIAGDNLMGFHISEFIDDFEEHGTPTLAAYDVGSREKAKSYGLVELDGDRVVGFQEKPDDPNSTLVSIACYAFPEESILFDKYLSGDNNPDEPGWFIQWLQEEEAVHAFPFEDDWYDIGSPASYLEAVEWELDGGQLIAEDATVEGSEIGENVHILPGVEVVDSTINRSIIFPNTTIENSAVEGSIVDKESTLTDVELDGAVIGENTDVTK